MTFAENPLYANDRNTATANAFPDPTQTHSTKYREDYTCVQVDLSEVLSNSDAFQWLEIRLTELEAQGIDKGTYLEINVGELVLSTSMVAKMRGLALRYGFVLTTLCSTVAQTQQSGLNEGLTVRNTFEIYEPVREDSDISRASAPAFFESPNASVDLPPMLNNTVPVDSLSTLPASLPERVAPEAARKKPIDDDILGNLLRKPTAVVRDLFDLPKRAPQKETFEDHMPSAAPVTAPVAPPVSANETDAAFDTLFSGLTAEIQPRVTAAKQDLPETTPSVSGTTEIYTNTYDGEPVELSLTVVAPSKVENVAMPVNEPVSQADISENDRPENVLKVILDDGSEQSMTLPEEASHQSLLYPQTLRSGQVLESSGNIVVMGDAHAGSEIKAGGNIVVWGTLSGIAQAGTNGNQQATVKAFRIEALQLRIGGLIARRPDKLFKKEAELTKNNQNGFYTDIARVNNGEICVTEEYFKG